MGSKFEQGNFSLEDFAKIKDGIKQAVEEETKKQQNGEKKPKQTLWKTILGIFLLLILVGIVAFVIIGNLDTILLPKNTVTVIVKDQDGEAIRGLKVRFNAGGADRTIEYEDIPNVIEFGVEPGDYDLYFENIPEDYECEKIRDTFTLEDGGKVKLEYTCNKK